MGASLPILSTSAMLLVAGCALAGAEAGPGGGGGGDGGSGNSGTTTSTWTDGGSSGSGAFGGTGGSSGGTNTGGTGGALTCDDVGECGNVGRGCVSCAINGACADVYDACFSSDDCKTYGSCVSMCADDEECLLGCEQQVPDGKAPYDAFFSCVICGECVTSCGPVEACPPPQP